MHNLYSGAPYPPGARTNVKRCESVFYVFDAVQRVSSVQLVAPMYYSTMNNVTSLYYNTIRLVLSTGNISVWAFRSPIELSAGGNRLNLVLLTGYISGGKGGR